MIDPEYTIKNSELIRILESFINFDAKTLYEIVEDVRKREIKDRLNSQIYKGIANSNAKDTAMIAISCYEGKKIQISIEEIP
jgi:hypothetical protein